MKKNNILIFFLSAVLLFSVVCSGCTQNLQKTGKNVSCKIENTDKTEYVICVSKNITDSQRYLDAINDVIDEMDCENLMKRYLTEQVKRKDFFGDFGELDVLDQTKPQMVIYTSVISPYQFSGAYGNGVDGVDMYLLVKTANEIGEKPVFYDYPYKSGYEMVKSGQGEIFASAVALTDDVEEDFLVSHVYSSGYQQIVSDEAYSYSKIEQLKGLTIGVLSGRPGETLINEAISEGCLKDTGAVAVVYETDAEAYSAYKAEDCDVIITDEYSAKVMLSD